MILARYINRQVLMPCGVILLILLLIFISAFLPKLLSDPMVAASGFVFLVNVIALDIPYFLFELLPLSFFLALIIAIGRLYVDLEIHVLFACAISKQQLFKWLLLPTLIMFVFALLLALWIKPLSTEVRGEYINEHMANSSFDALVEKTFNPIGSEHGIMYFERFDTRSKQYQQVFISKVGEHVIKARFARIERSDKMRFLTLYNGSIYRSLPGEEDFSRTDFRSYSFKIEEQQLQASTGYNKLSSWQLLQQLDNKKLIELNRRLSFALMIIALLPIGMIFSQSKPRKNHFWKVIPAILIFFIYSSMVQAFHDAIENAIFPAWLGSWLLHIMVFLIAIFWLFKEDVLGRLKA